MPHLQGHDSNAVSGGRWRAISVSACGAGNPGSIVVQCTDDSGAMGSVAVEVARIVVGVVAVLAGPAPESVERAGDEVVSDDVIDEAVIVIIDSRGTVGLRGVLPHVATGRQEIAGGRRVSGEVRVIPLDTSIEHGHDD